MPNWTKEHFTVSQALPVKNGTKRRVYKLVDYNNGKVKGSRYREKIQEITDNQYCIEKVLKRRTIPDGTKILFFSWEGWTDNYNSWIK